MVRSSIGMLRTLAVTLTLTGCTADVSPGDSCDLAAQHATACLGGEVPAGADQTCDERAAERILMQDCAELLPRSAASAGGSTGNGVMCELGKRLKRQDWIDKYCSNDAPQPPAPQPQCPAGMRCIQYNGQPCAHCIDGSPQTPTPFYEAFEACLARGLSPVSFSWWRLAAVQGIVSEWDGEWGSPSGGDVCFVWHAPACLAGNTMCADPQACSTPARYRCGRSPI